MSWLEHPFHCTCVECSAPEPSYAGTRGAARALIERLARRGVSFEFAGDKLRLYPKGAVGDNLEKLRCLKPDVVRLLAEDEARKEHGEGRIRDELEVFDLVRKHFKPREDVS